MTGAEVGAVVLCGGRSTRMGADKATLPFGPETLVERAVRQVRVACPGPVVVVAASCQDLPALPEGVRVVRDPVADRGPLPALGLGLDSLPAGTALAYATSTDAPWLAPGWVDLLVESMADGIDAAVVVDADGRPHPLAAVYRVGPVAAAVRELVASGRSRLRDLIDGVPARRIPEGAMRAADPNLRTLRNLNTPDAYRRAVGELGGGFTGQGPGSPR